ncbi:hypothetical protein SAY87_027099 [Trapa incisa]|uniref:Centromere protein X n=1 Tax=Trapa incisa TaxID=236973 RepID=A0AAN7JM83_9MYRT|nr:hypothetical protein SAY87_027099 [Trapa incisa]
MEDERTFDSDLIHAIFKIVWTHRAQERARKEADDVMAGEVAAGPSKKNRSTSANTNALKLSSELLRLFVIEAIQRATTIADAEGSTRIEATHLERILPQFLLDFSVYLCSIYGRRILQGWLKVFD